MSEVARLIRKHIQQLQPYSSARSEFQGKAQVFLDANESPFENPCAPGYNRYPDSQHVKLVALLAQRLGVCSDNIILGNGSDELIDLLVRCLCDPSKDGILIFPPTYGMYEVVARSHALTVKQILLTKTFNLPLDKIASADLSDVKITFLCRPNNPSGGLPMGREQVGQLLQCIPGVLVVDEAYIDFCPDESVAALVASNPRLVVLRTFSKAWGLAGLRAGYALGDCEIINAMRKLKMPYNLNSHTLNALQAALSSPSCLEFVRERIIYERSRLINRLQTSPLVSQVFASNANFILVRFYDAEKVYRGLLARGIVTRNRSNEPHCDNCLRITVGSAAQNDACFEAFQSLEREEDNNE